MTYPSYIRALRLSGVGLLLICSAVGALMPQGAGRAGPSSERPLEVPLHSIDREFRSDARALMDSPTLVRRLPTRFFASDRFTYEYLLEHLPLASKLSLLLDYGAYRVVRMENGRLHGRDFSGVEGDFWEVLSGSGKRVYLGEGSYDTWYTPKITARVLLVADYWEISSASDADPAEVHGGGAEGSAATGMGNAAGGRSESPEGGNAEMATRIDIYVSTNRLVGYLMELLGTVTDKKLSQLVSSAQRTSERVSENPRQVWGLMKSSEAFTAEEIASFREIFLGESAREGEATPAGPTSRQ